MADANANTTQEDVEKKKKNVLDEKSKEDLIKLVKKYLGLLQKAKNKSDELTEKCTVLEKERNIALIERQSCEKQLSNEIEVLKDDILKLNDEKDQEIAELKQKLERNEEKKIQAPSLRENEEQLQCLNLQLQSLKASCQCIQEENSKFQKLIKEKSEEIRILTDEKNELKLSFNLTVEECNTLLNDKHLIENEYKKSCDLNGSLQLKVNELETLNKISHNSDISVLIKDNEDLCKENECLKELLKSKTNGDLHITSTDVKDIQSVANCNDVTTIDRDELAALERAHSVLSEQNSTLQCKLDKCQEENSKLQDEIKKFSYLFQMNDYKSGIEFALLQGATTEGLLYSDEQPSVKLGQVQSENSNFKGEVPGMNSQNESMYFEDPSGLEYALLQGGDTSKIAIANESEQILNESELYGIGMCENYEQKPLSQEEIIEKQNYEIGSLRYKLDEYSSLCKETMDENELLKKKLDNLESKSFYEKELMDKGVNTDLEPVYDEYSKFAIKGREDINEDSSALELYKHLCSVISDLYERLSIVGSDFQNSKQVIEPMSQMKEIECIFKELYSDLESKQLKLNEFNLQLELLVIGIKQGVRQKSSANAAYQANNNIEENIHLLKILLDDLVLRANNLTSKIKNLENCGINEKKKIEEELLKAKELNQFLEIENRELNDEITKINSNGKDYKNSRDQETYENMYDNNVPNLYSIEESNEFDEKADTNANVVTSDNLISQNVTTCEFSTQTSFEVEDFAVQVHLDVHGKDIEVNDDITVMSVQQNENDMLAIQQLTKENDDLKRSVIEKTHLVENIHCQMDSLLTKVEELTTELQYKEDDLKHSQCLIADLKKINVDLENVRQQQLDALKSFQKYALDFKTQNINLSSDVKSFTLTFKDLMSHLGNSINDISEQNSTVINNFKDKYNHKEENLKIIKEWVNESIKDFKFWFDYLNENIKTFDKDSNVVENIDLSPLEKSLEISPLLISSHEIVCEQDSCCLILKHIENMNCYKTKLLSYFFSLLNNNYIPLIKEYNHFKETVVPNLNKNITDLEKKISECTIQVNAEIAKTDVDPTPENLAESLKSQLTDTETKMNKFKQIAVKMKRELTLTKEQFNEVTLEKEKLQRHNEKILEEISKITDDQCKYVQNYQSLQNEFDKLQDDCEMHKINIKKLEEDLSNALHGLMLSKERVVSLESELKASKQCLESSSVNMKELEIKCADFESKVIIYESKISEEVQKINSLEADIAKHVKDLNASFEENKKLKDQLDQAQREGKKKNLLDLEMADYERSITELNNQLQKKDNEIEELKNEIKCLNENNESLCEEIKSTESLKETEEKRAESLKEILEKTKLELNKVKEHESELVTKTASLQVQFESLTQQQEDYKLRLSEASAQIQHLQDVIKTSSDNHKRIVKSFEQKISNQKQEILVAHNEIESVKQEFENYKIRVHSVFKQQKNVTPSIATIDVDLKDKLEAMNEKFKLQLKDLSDKLTAMSLEYETLQEEHDALLQRYNKAIDDREQKDKEWHQRLELINAEKNRLRATHEELSSQHLLQNEMLVATYKKQIKIMSEEHKRIVSDLQKQLDAADVEIARLQRDQQNLQGLPMTPVLQDSSSTFDILSQERQEGEGSENTDGASTPIRHLSLATIPSSGFLPFEKLLQTPIEPGTPSSYISTHETEKLTSDLQTANKKIDHLSDLLNDSESTNLRMSEQVRVLKDEVRRLENNKEREQHAENLEYLKNVFIKFASLQPGSERAMLIPVLTTMLKLNSDEQQQLKSVAGDFDAGESNAGWSSYLHRWSGLS